MPMSTAQWSRRHVLGAAATVAGAGALAAAGPGSPALADEARHHPYGLRRGEYFPRGAELTSITAIDVTGRSDPELTVLATAQGLAARTASTPHLYLTSPGSVDQLWLDDLHAHGVKVRHASDVWKVLAGQHIDRFVRYSADDTSLSVATTAAGVLDAVAVEESLVSAAIGHGLHQVLDVRGKDDAWSFAKLFVRTRHDFAVEQKDTFSYPLRDLGTMAAAFTYYDGNSALRARINAALAEDSPIIGWGDADDGENTFVGPSSDAGNVLVAADWARNTATLSSVPATKLRQHERTPLRARAGRHYVSFVVTDGDNLQWMTTTLPASTDWWANPRRGDVALGWGMPPSMLDLAPSALRWYYDDAGRGARGDQFTVGPSGSGYFYPSRYPRATLLEHTKRLDRVMRRTDVDVVQILDFDALTTPGLWDAYTRRRSVSGLIYLEYSRYDREAGKTIWSNGKPVTSARHMLWDGLDGADEASVTAALNAARTDPRSVDSYSIVAVHAWSKTVDDVLTVVDGLAEHVEVVCPGDLIKLMRATVKR